MSPKFCQRQALLLYVESEPQGTSPVPNVESLVFTPWKYAICLTISEKYAICVLSANYEYYVSDIPFLFIGIHPTTAVSIICRTKHSINYNNTTITLILVLVAHVQKNAHSSFPFDRMAAPLVHRSFIRAHFKIRKTRFFRQCLELVK